MADKKPASGTLAAAFTVAQIGASLYAGSQKRKTGRAAAAAQNAVNEASQKVRDAANAASAAEARLQNTVQFFTNRRGAKYASRREATAKAAIAASREGDSAGTFERKIAASATAGALAAEAAWSGTTGGTTDIIAGNMALAQARQEEAVRRQGRARDYGLTLDASGAAESIVQGVDNRTVFATLDRSVATQAVSQVGGSAYNDFMRSAEPGALLKAAETIQTGAEALYKKWTTPADTYAESITGDR